MSEKTNYPKCLRVMAEYTSSGIWVTEPHGVFRHGMVSHQALGLPLDLSTQFNDWIESYWGTLDDTLNVEQFNHRGKLLARALKRHVGKTTKVLFVYEACDGESSVEEIEIEAAEDD
jgi:hypothetical protein